MLLSDHIRETADIIAGYVTGTLVIENNTVSLLKLDGELITVNEDYSIEVRNDRIYESVTVSQVIDLRTEEGWPLLSGIYTRIKKIVTLN
ncbi:hypothetical protein PAECIP111891_06739 [Paenibacillus allorhizoplanae]|uniref:Uncharacterized protein n=1 Tax=Paenibacillus allorhizoplanae TaxID=2905648 RepID=A0ABM9D0D1_9BACL|nr:hypothetical protein [Paenibacillus allorhizoplanae]CAH1230736.1 hypothetical protein PAECIP111891_06739 [Paenibacillus allorhizoplanae]